jgi:hypothetical protein
MRKILSPKDLQKLINDRLDELDKESFLNERQTDPDDPEGYDQQVLLIQKTYSEIENRKAHAALERERRRAQGLRVKHKTRGNVFLWHAYDGAIEDMKRIRQIWREQPELKKRNGVHAPSALQIAAERWKIKADVLLNYKNNNPKNRRR